ncbi:MAG: T9SS type A sorting domain-containing protein [Chitinophagaceae bacterium]
MKRSLFLFLMVLRFCANAQSPTWQFTGPSLFPTNISGQINGIGRVCQIKFSPTDSNLVYACSASGGLWKSTNAGLTWSNAGTDYLPVMSTSSVCLDHSNPNIIYLSSGDPNYYSTDYGIYKTTNGGSSWVLSNNGIGTRMAVELLMDPQDNLTLIAATSSGVWKTTDGGQNWTETLVGNQFTDLQWQPLQGSSVLYASAMNRFFRSTDKGSTWTEVVSGFSNLLGQGTRIGVSAADPARVYVAGVLGEGRIFMSTDTGKTFTVRYNNPSVSLTGYDTNGGGQGNYNFCFIANPNNPNQVYLASHNVWRSEDGGVNWSQLTNWWEEIHTDMHHFAFQPGNANALYNANDGGVWQSTNSGVNWTQRSNGLGATENYNAAVHPVFPNLISTGTQDNGELVYIDNVWKTNRGGDWTSRMMMDYSTQKRVYYHDELERRDLPSGGNQAYNLPAAILGSQLKHAFVANNPQIAFASGTQLWRTKNLQTANPVWETIHTFSNASIQALAGCKTYPNIVAYIRSNAMFISHNALDSIPTFTQKGLPVSGIAKDLYISSVDTNRVYFIMGAKVYRLTTPNGNFADYSTGLPPNLQFQRILGDDYSGLHHLYVMNAADIYYRNDTMSAWTLYTGNLPTIAGIKNMMMFNDGGADAKLYVSYYGRGVWETGLMNTNTCAIPAQPQAVYNNQQIILSWPNLSALGYGIQYRIEGEYAWHEASSSSNSYVIDSAKGCSRYEIRVRTHCATDTSVWSARTWLQTPSDALTTDFDGHQDIGAVGAVGDVCYNAQEQRYTVYGAGEDIWDKQDEFHFLYKKLANDVTISARVRRMGNSYPWAKAGVMIRETLTPDSKHAMCAMTPGNGFAMQWREQTNDWTSNKDTAGTTPGWVKLERSGNIVNSYFSLDGQQWDLLQSAIINMADTVYVGLAHTSHLDSTINDAEFDHIVINSIPLGLPSVENNGYAPMRIYPNPSRGELHLQLQENDGPIQLLFYSLEGKLIQTRHTRLKQQQADLQVDGLAPGTYFIQVKGQRNYISTWVIRP